MAMTSRDGAPVGVVHYGLGPIGVDVARLVRRRADLRPAAAADVRPDILGRDLGELTGDGETGMQTGVVISSAEHALAASDASVVVLCTGSSLERVAPQLLGCVRAGLPVVSTCEELSYPWDDSPELARQLDEAARSHGVAVVGTGVNPGFAMDYLPVVLASAAAEVTHVRVRRVQDAAARRLPLQRKVGVGLTSDEFAERVADGSVRHVGLRESARMLGAAFGWRFTVLEERIEPVLAERPVLSGLGDVPEGRVRGVRQVVTGSVGGVEVCRLTLEMAVGLPGPRDEIELTGNPPLRLVLPGGAHGDVATGAMVVNTIGRLLAAPPGLRAMTDLPPPGSQG